MIPLGRCVNHFPFPCLHCLMIELYHFNRMGVPEECAGAVSYLSGDDSKYVTGETLVIAGGMLSRL